MRVDKHFDTVIARGKETRKFVQDRRFISLHELQDDVFEIKLRKRNIRWRLPLHLGYSIYQYAKMELLKLVYGMIQRFIHPRDYIISCGDTDSVYFGISKNTLNAVIKPEMRQVFEQEKHLWFPRTQCKYHTSNNFEADADCLQPPSEEQQCCYDCYLFDLRLPGLWKLEKRSDSICALNPKSYICIDHTEDGNQTVKLSAKGVARSNTLLWKDYVGVFNTGIPHMIENRGIQQTQLYTLGTYHLKKRGLSYLYIKRKIIGKKGSETMPLDL